MGEQVDTRAQDIEVVREWLDESFGRHSRNRALAESLLDCLPSYDIDTIEGRRQSDYAHGYTDGASATAQLLRERDDALDLLANLGGHP